MAPLSFRKTEKPQPQPQPPTSASTPGSLTLTDNATFNNNNSSPASTDRSFASRLLRRKPSVNAKSNNIDSDVPSLVPNTASTTSTFGDEFDLPSRNDSFNGVRRGSEPPYGLRAPKSGWGSEGDSVVVIDGGTGMVNPGLSKTAAEHPFMNQVARPSTPLQNGTITDLTPAPVYPTALSPPRRPMPRSRPVIPDSSSRTSSSFSVGDSSAEPAAAAPSPSYQSHTVTAEWLSRRPSGRRGDGSASASTSSDRDSPRKLGGLGGPAHIRTGSSSRRAVSSSSAEASTSGADSEDGEIGIFTSKRRSVVAPARDGNGTYEVEVACTDSRDDNDEMKWEVVIRRRRPTTDSSHAPTSPLQLSTSSSVAQAPSTASSINLSLSLDQPTGKLVFIAFPMDIHATPRRKPSSATTPSSRPPTTPPPPPPSSSRTPPPRSSTPPPAPNPNSSPTTPPRTLAHKKRVSQSSLWPSPSRNAGRRSGSPPLGGPSPRSSEVWTPRRTRMVSASELNGGLYAPGTVDGMSEVLEGTSISSLTNGTSTPNTDDRRARWQHDRI